MAVNISINGWAKISRSHRKLPGYSNMLYYSNAYPKESSEFGVGSQHLYYEQRSTVLYSTKTPTKNTGVFRAM